MPDALAGEWTMPDAPPAAQKRPASGRKGVGSADAPRKGLAPGGAQAKGAAGERDVLSAFRDIMVNVEQEVMQAGYQVIPRSGFTSRKRIEKGTSSRDISHVPIISIEVKRQENLNLNKAWEQAVRQADGGLLPVLVYRYNREAWRVRTWVALTHYDTSARVVRYAVGEVTLVDFLPYFASMYRDFLLAGIV